MTDGEVMQEINARKRKRGLHVENGNLKKYKTGKHLPSLKISKITFPRSRIFYGMGKKTRSGQNWIIGLPRDHILQKIKLKQFEIDDLLKIVFPDCFGLQSVIASHPIVIQNNQNTIIPKRLEKASRLLKWIIYRHSICNYSALIDYYCPKIVSFDFSKDEEKKENNEIEYHLKHEQVVNFVWAVFLKVFPIDIWGSLENQKLVFKCS